MGLIASCASDAHDRVGRKVCKLKLVAAIFAIVALASALLLSGAPGASAAASHEPCAMAGHADLGATDPCSESDLPGPDACQPGMACHISSLGAPVEAQIPVRLAATRIRQAPAPGRELVSHPPDQSIRPPIAR